MKILDVKSGEWKQVNFRYHQHTILRSGFQSDAFTVCAGIIVYFSERRLCALMHSPPNHRVGVEFWEWFNAQDPNNQTQIVIIPSKVSGSNPGKIFDMVLSKMKKIGSHVNILTRTENVRVMISAQGYEIYNYKNEVLTRENWQRISQHHTRIPIFIGSSLNNRFETDNPMSYIPRYKK